MSAVLMLIYLLAVPLLVMKLAERWPWIDKVSPMTVLYLIGLAVGNCGLLSPSSDNAAIAAATETNTLAGNVAIPLAIPLMLMGCNLRKWSTGKALKAFFSGLCAVLIATVAGYFLFRHVAARHLSPQDYAQVCAVATGIYTGGIPNMGAIKQGVGMNQELYLCVTSYDLIVTGLYLLFIVFFGKTFFRKLLPAARLPRTSKAFKASKTSKAFKAANASSVPEVSSAYSASALRSGSAVPQEPVAYAETKKLHPFDAAHWRGSLLLMGLALGVAVFSYALATCCFGGHANMTILILALTTLSVAASFLPVVQRQEQSFDLGFYFVCVFCLSIATSCDIRRIDLFGNLSILWYIFFIVFGSIVMQVLFARLLRLDGDSVMVTSVALINSPPFVPMVAALLKNKDVVILGIFVGLLGYVCGNYLGIGVYHLLMLFGG